MGAKRTITGAVMWRSGCLVEQLAGPHAERLRQLFDEEDRRIARTALEIADIGAVNASAIGVFLLAPALGVPETAQVCGKALADIHKREQTLVSLIVLQTISDIRR